MCLTAICVLESASFFEGGGRLGFCFFSFSYLVVLLVEVVDVLV